MKKISNYIIRLLLIVLMLSSYFITPLSVSAASKATTVGELKQELAELQQKKKNTENQKNQTAAEINQKNRDINNAYNEIEASEVKIKEAKSDIEKAKERIAEYEKKTQEMIKFYQIMSGENTYLEFITDSASMTELIMRIDAVEEIVEYNQKVLKDLEQSIKELEQKQVELKNYEVQLNNNIASYEQKIKQLDSRLLALEDDAIDINEEIYNLKETISMYVNLGCKDNDKLDVCSMNSNNATWLKPVAKGRINSLFGWRNVAGQSKYHSGIDIGIAEGTTVYAIANGTVINVVYKSSCGGNKVYVQCIVGGQKYTYVFAHLLSISVNKGDKVTTNTAIGKSGGGSTATRNGGYDRCTTGAHLHLSISKGYYTSYANYVAGLINPPGYPGKGAYFYSRTQWFG